MVKNNDNNMSNSHHIVFEVAAADPPLGNLVDYV